MTNPPSGNRSSRCSQQWTWAEATSRDTRSARAARVPVRNSFLVPKMGDGDPPKCVRPSANQCNNPRRVTAEESSTDLESATSQVLISHVTPSEHCSDPSFKSVIDRVLRVA